MKVTLDVDSVLADIMVSWCQEYNRRRYKEIQQGKAYPLFKSDITMWDIHHQHPIEEPEIYDIFHVVWTQHWQDIPPTEPNIGEVVNDIIKKGHRVSIVTARKRLSIPTFMQWLFKHNIPYHDLTIIEDNRPKSDFPFDILLDDGIHNVTHLVPLPVIDDAPIPQKIGVLMSQPWNLNEDHPYRAVSVSEFSRLYL